MPSGTPTNGVGAPATVSPALRIEENLTFGRLGKMYGVCVVEGPVGICRELPLAMSESARRSTAELELASWQGFASGLVGVERMRQRRCAPLCVSHTGEPRGRVKRPRP